MAIEWITLTDETIINDLKLFNKEVPQTEISHLEKISMICPRYNRKGKLSRYPSLLEEPAGVQYRVPKFPARFASIGGPSPLGGIVKIGVFRS